MSGPLPELRRRPAVNILLWAWVVGGGVAYLYQFRSLVEPLMRLIGDVV